MVDHIKSFGKINCLGQYADWGTRLIKALSYFIARGRRAVVMEWVVRKPCGLEERESKLGYGCKRRSKTLTAGQRREMRR